MRFVAEFDRAAIFMSMAAILILLYFGLAYPTFTYDYWVAFAFWTIGFFGSLFLGITKRTTALSIPKLLTTAVFTAILLVIFIVINEVYAVAVEAQQVLIAEKLVSAAIGISEELFFGVFLLGLLINLLSFPRFISILASSGVHTYYHVARGGFDPLLLWVFFMSFTLARTVYVYFWPRVSIILGAHGFWNFGVS